MNKELDLLLASNFTSSHVTFVQGIYSVILLIQRRNDAMLNDISMKEYVH